MKNITYKAVIFSLVVLGCLLTKDHAFNGVPPAFTDVDGDGLPDDWEIAHFGGLDVPGGGAGESWNHDGVTNLVKFQNGSNPTAVNGSQQTENPGGPHVALKIFTPLE